MSNEYLQAKFGEEFDNSHKKVAGLVIAGAIYLFGVGINAGNHQENKRDELNLLNKEKSELVQKIDTYEEFIPKLKEPFVAQYEDSLSFAIKDTSGINTEMRNISEKYDEDKNVWQSWYYLFK